MEKFALTRRDENSIREIYICQVAHLLRMQSAGVRACVARTRNVICLQDCSAARYATLIARCGGLHGRLIAIIMRALENKRSPFRDIFCSEVGEEGDRSVTFANLERDIFMSFAMVSYRKSCPFRVFV